VVHICRAARRQGIKVLLSGAGGDDLFTGYRRHLALQSEALWGWWPRPLRRGLRRRLNRWHRQVQRDCAQFASLDIEARHRLRKRFKRLRYGVEFCASLFDAEALKRQLKPVVKAQEVLGELNDLELAITERRALSAEPQQDARAWFELGWLGARRTELLARSEVLMTAVAEAPKLL